MVDKIGNSYIGTILVVDDEQDLREILRMDLEESGHRIIEARCGNSAFEVIQREHVDLVISDVRMADGSGFDLLKMVQAHNPGSPMVLFVSGHFVPPAEAKRMGAEDVLLKPWKPGELIAIIQRLLANKYAKSQRKTERHPVEWHVEFNLPTFQQGQKGKVLNLSRGGMFVTHSDLELEVGKQIVFNVLSPTGRGIEGIGVVRWIRKKTKDQFLEGFGVQFIKIAEHKEDEFESILEELKD